jgi:hypothetical protein
MKASDQLSNLFYLFVTDENKKCFMPFIPEFILEFTFITLRRDRLSRPDVAAEESQND